MVSASCPNCSIYLVEANSDSDADLDAAEVEAVALGAHIISNSFGCFIGRGCEFSESDFDTPGVTYVAGAGDTGYTAMLAPAAFGSVVSAGGTSLYVDAKSTRGFSETAWLGTGSGCARKQKKPSWQHDPGCNWRTANDVASVSDPATGPAIYDTYGNYGWFVGGGTSAASPFIAGVFGLAGNASSQNGGETFWQLSHERSSDLFHIKYGYNGSCSDKYLCTDGTHEYRSYGGPTGWGTPNGIGAF
jgi:subtilase family serine protease